MILRVYEPSAKFGLETTEYHDYVCNKYQIYNGILHVMRFNAHDLYIPLSSIKLFQDLPEPVEPLPAKLPAKLTDSMLEEVLVENNVLLERL